MINYDGYKHERLDIYARGTSQVSMFSAFVAFGLASVLVGVKCSERIVGLERIMSLPNNEERGWVFLQNYHDMCAGVLMSPTEVLTTCECVIDNSMHGQLVSRYKREGDEIRLLDLAELRVRTKDIMSSLDSDYINITEVRIHPKCDGYGSYDFAMMRLERPVNVSDRAFANFPFGEEWNGKWSSTSEPDVGCHLATHLTNALMWRHPLWAEKMYGDISEIPVTFIRMEECDKFTNVRKRRKTADRDAQICVEANPKPLPICKADLGSPLICNETLIGITTVTEMVCNQHDDLSIVSSLDGAWEFIYDFMDISHGYWYTCYTKKLYSWLMKLFKFLVTFGL